MRLALPRTRTSACLIGLAILAVGVGIGDAVADEDEDGGERVATSWPQWRGPLGTGVAPGADPPLRWSETENVRWRTEIPGRGHSSPIVWRDRVFLTTAVPFGEEVEPAPYNVPPEHDNVEVARRHAFVAVAVDRATGKIAWQTELRRALPHAGGHGSGTLASASPVTDGEVLIVFFGSNGLFALDLDGAKLWERDFGRMETKHKHGEGASPALFGDTVVVNWDHEGPSFLVALDKRTGKTRWRVDRDEVTSWSSPIIVEHGGTAQAIVNGTRRVRGYDLRDGRVIWECGGLSSNVVATPVAANGVVYVGSSYETKALFAVRLDGAEGDVTGTDQVVWFRSRRTPYVPSPLLYDDALYVLGHYQNVLSVVNATTGAEPHGPWRIDDLYNVYASLVGAAGRVYVADLAGTTVVLSHAEEPAVLATNRLDDVFAASPALVDRELFLRGDRSLYCIAEPESE